jgi:hypothetical protein
MEVPSTKEDLPTETTTLLEANNHVQPARPLFLASCRARRFELILAVVIITVLGFVSLKALDYEQNRSSSFVIPANSVLVGNESFHEKRPVIAFMGDSMIFYNDMPRLIQRLANYSVVQNSCLHMSASLSNILQTGSGMSDRFDTPNAMTKEGYYDMGACTIKQLLLGYDEDLNKQVYNHRHFYEDDGTNPCLQSKSYLTYLNNLNWQKFRAPKYVVINDNTCGPGRNTSREESINILKQVYAPLFRESGVTPVFYDTYGYWTTPDIVDLSGFTDVPNFASLTYEGYKEYSAALAELLPKQQAPRVAPAGIAWLTVWEENRTLWNSLFHQYDHLHPATAGTMLSSFVIYYTIFGKMPDKSIVFASHDMAKLFSHARVLQQADQPPDPFPTYREIEYLYDVAYRVMHLKYVPKAFTFYNNSEAAAGR